MEEQAVLSGDNAYNAHFGEYISAIGDIDDDGYQGQCEVIASRSTYAVTSGAVRLRWSSGHQVIATWCIPIFLTVQFSMLTERKQRMLRRFWLSCKQ